MVPVGLTPDEPTIGAYVLFHRDVPLAEAVGIIDGRGGLVRSMLNSVNGLVVEMSLGGLISLAGADPVQWIEPALPRLGEVNDGNRLRTQADIVQAPPYGLDGTGVAVLLYDACFSMIG